jgi:caffeoyl-CoA O-methyltransferase
LAYYEEIVPRLRRGGLLVADNTLQGGRVFDADADNESTVAIGSFNDRVAADRRIRVVLLPIDRAVRIGDNGDLIRVHEEG